MAAHEDIISPAAVFRSLVKLEAKQDAILENQKEILVEHGALKARLSKVEQRQSWYMGAVAAVVGVITLLPKYWEHIS